MVNASNLYVGGGVQVGISVLKEFFELNVNFIAAVSPVIYAQIADDLKEKCFLIEKSPSGLFNVASRRMLDFLVAEWNVKKVFTVFGPSYWTPKKVEHTVGFALPWLIYDKKYIFRKLKLKQKIKHLILQFIQPFYFRKNADKIIAETEDARLKCSSVVGFPIDKVFCIPNALNAKFYQENNPSENIKKALPLKNKGDVWLLTIAHNYPHKNLDVIAELLKLLPSNFKFVLTISDEFLKDFQGIDRSRLVFLGSVNVEDCSYLYKVSDAMFLPTLLECFSASYIEAAYMRKPIFTSDLSFAHTICKDGAFYFDPYSAMDISRVIKKAFSEPRLIEDKCQKMVRVYEGIPSASERACLYLKVIDV